jgi:RecA-family ATPase
MDVTKFIELVQQEHDKMVESAQPEKGDYDNLLTLEEKGWLLTKPPQRQYLFNYQEAFDGESGFLPKGKACMIASPGGCGKTFLLAHCALAAATGSSWLSSKSTGPIKVLFVAAEEEEDELWNRFHNMVKGLEIGKDKTKLNKALKNIIALPLRGKNQRFIDGRGKETKTYLDLKKALEDNPDIQLVILDPAARFMGPETEISNAAATDWVNLVDALTLVGGKPTVLVAHHTNKTALRPVGNDKKPVFDQSMCRGASALVDGFRWVLGLQRSQAENESKTIYVKLLKTNYCKIGDVLEFMQDFDKGGIFVLKNGDQKSLTPEERQKILMDNLKKFQELNEKRLQEQSDEEESYEQEENDNFDDNEPIENWGTLV